MFTSFFLGAREALEAALVVGIILAQLVRNKRTDLSKYVYLGIASGAIICLIGGVILFVTLGEFENNEVVEGYVMLLAALFIAYIPFWLHRNSNNEKIENKVSKDTGALSLFLLAFLSVFREGMELVVFILAKAQKSAWDISIGATLGIAFAVVITILLFKTSVKLNISLIFSVLGFFLVFLGGSLFSGGLGQILDLSSGLQYILEALFIVGALTLLYQKDIKRLLTKEV